MGLFGGLYVVFCLVLGLMLAILLDQKIRGEGHPAADLSLSAGAVVHRHRHRLEAVPRSRLGLEKAVHDWGWTSFHFDWVVNPRMMIYCVAIAGVWQTSGFVMAMFLAGLRGIDGEILKAAQIDGASRLRHLLAHRHPDHAAGVPLGADHPHPYGDQELRPGPFGHRQEPGRRGGAAVHLHVLLHLHARPDGGRLGERGDHADDHRRDHGALSLFGAAGRSTDERRRRLDRRAVARAGAHSATTRIVIYGLLVLFALVYLLPLVVMVMTSLKPLDEVTGGNMSRCRTTSPSSPG